MAHWDNAAVTREGIVLLNEMMAGHELILTRACGGTGSVEVSDMVEQTGLQEEKQTLKLTDEKDSPDGKTVTVQISSIGNEAEYLLQQIGVYAKLDTEGAVEKLLFIMQDEGVLIPAESDKSFLLEIFCALRIGENGKLTVIVDPTGIVTLDRLSQTESKFDRLLGEIDPLSGTGEPDSTTPGQVGQKYEDTTSGDIYTCTAITPGESGASPHYLWVPGKLGTLAEIRTAYSNISGRVTGTQLFHNARWDRKAYIINQRGKFEYTEDGFSLDRWGMSNCTTLILDRGVKIISNLGKHAYWGQAIEGYRLIEHQVTCSVFCADGALFTWTIDLKTPNPFPTSKTCIYHKYCGRINLEIWILPSNQSILFQFNIGENETAEILALKNEPGPISTLCRKDAAGNWVLNNPPPDQAVELLKCQRYLYVIGSNNFTDIGWYQCREAGTISLHINLPVQMRNTPAISGFYGSAVKNGPDGIGYMPINPAVITGKFLYGSSLILGIKCPEAMPGDYGWVQLDPEVFVTIDSNI